MCVFVWVYAYVWCVCLSYSLKPFLRNLDIFGNFNFFSLSKDETSFAAYPLVKLSDCQIFLE